MRLRLALPLPKLSKQVPPSARAWLQDPRLMLACILGLAFIVRVYNLGVPSLWNDELMPPVMVSKPLEYFLRWNWLEEVHPPLFFGFVKAALLMGKSNFALRLPSMVFGLASVWLIYRLGRDWYGEGGGLLAAAVLAVDPAHVYLSRAVRFYAFTMLLCLVGLLLLSRFLKFRNNSDLAALIAVLGVLLFAEFTAVMPIAAFFLILAVVLLAGPDRMVHMKRLARYTALAFCIPLLFLVLVSIVRQNFSMKSTMMQALDNYLGALTWLLAQPDSRGGHHWQFWFLSVAAVLGALHLAATKWRRFAVCLSFLVVPALILMVIRPAYSLAYWHLFFLLPILILLVADALMAVLAPAYQPLAALGIALAGTWALLGPFAQSLYTKTAYDADYQEVAKAVTSFIPSGSPVLVDTNAVDFVDWYAGQYSLDNRWLDQHVPPHPGPLSLNLFVGPTSRLGHLVDPAHPVSSWASVGVTRSLGLSRLEEAIIERQPDVPLDLSGKARILDAHPARFYGFVHQADRVVIDPYWGNAVMPSRNNVPGTFAYRLTNPEGGGDRVITLDLAYRNPGIKNRFQATVRFDDEEPVTFVDSTGPDIPASGRDADDSLVKRQLVLRRVNPFLTITVDVAMTCALLTPRFPTSNLATVEFSKLAVRARPFGPDLLDMAALDPLFSLAGFRDVEHEGERHWRWAVGPQNSIDFTLDRDTPMRLTYALVNPFPSQDYTVALNGTVLATVKDLPHGDWKDPVTPRTLDILAKAGHNRLIFAFKNINHVNASFSDTDATPYAAAFTVLRLEAVTHK